MGIPASPLVEFGEWLPDLGEYNNPGALIVKGCVPEGDRYKPFKMLQPFSDALPLDCKGAFAYRDASGNVTIFAGTTTNLYKLVDTSWVDVTRLSGGNYATGDDGFWKFVNFGNLIIATNYNNDIQVFDISTDANFSQLSATAPRCRNMFILKNFLVCVDVVDGDGATGYRVSWSPLANPEGDWTDINVQADFQDIFGGDFANVAGVSIQDVGYIIQEKAIWRMEYIGGSQIFRFEFVENAKGSFSGRSVISNGKYIFYPGEDGFYRFDGVESYPIGDRKIDKTFFDDLDVSFDYRMNVAVDPINKNILWAYPSKSSVDGLPDKIIIHNWTTERWTTVDQVTQILMKSLSSGFTLEDLDDIDTNLELIPFSLDSRIWAGGKTIFGAFDDSNRLSAFDGEPMELVIETREIRENPSGHATLHSVLPYIEGDETTVITGRIGCRELLTKPISWTGFTGVNNLTGELEVLKDVRFVRAEIHATGNWSKAIGLSTRLKISGDV